MSDGNPFAHPQGPSVVASDTPTNLPTDLPEVWKKRFALIERAGGPDRWRPTEADLRDPELRVWQWLQRPPVDLPVFIGHGSDDRFAERIQQVADRFPPTSRHIFSGGHDWAAWLPLWERFLDVGHFGR